MGQNHKTLLVVFRQHNEDYAKQVGKMKSQRSWVTSENLPHSANFFLRSRKN